MASYSIKLTEEQWLLIYDLLRHRELELRAAAAYVAYSSAYNQSPERCREREAQTEGALECGKILDKLHPVIGSARSERWAKMRKQHDHGNA